MESIENGNMKKLKGAKHKRFKDILTISIGQVKDRAKESEQQMDGRLQ
jgi:hypothetical protein